LTQNLPFKSASSSLCKFHAPNHFGDMSIWMIFPRNLSAAPSNLMRSVRFCSWGFGDEGKTLVQLDSRPLGRGVYPSRLPIRGWWVLAIQGFGFVSWMSLQPFHCERIPLWFIFVRC
jgi:hypothetical protein